MLTVSPCGLYHKALKCSKLVGMGEIEIFALAVLFMHHSVLVWFSPFCSCIVLFWFDFLRSVHASFSSGLIFSIPFMYHSVLVWFSPFRSCIILFWFDFLRSIHVSFCSGLIFSIQGENGWDYQSKTIPNEA